MKKIILLFFTLFTLSSFSQNFNGYIQTRFQSDFENYGFEIRRLKIWLKDDSTFFKNWHYKIQTTFSSKKNEIFFLQDVYLIWQKKHFALKFGQFIPNFSLQRFQSDYKMIQLERAVPTNRLLPGSGIGIRDLGVQMQLNTSKIYFFAGIFNGKGIPNYFFEKNNYLVTSQLKIMTNVFTGGISFAYRRANNMIFKKILPDTVIFTGRDIRYNSFIRLKIKNLSLQAEWFSALFDKQNAKGYYFLAEYKKNKNALAVSYENYSDLIENTTDFSYLRATYSFEFEKYYKKILLSGLFSYYNNDFDFNLISIQFQMFLKSKKDKK